MTERTAAPRSNRGAAGTPDHTTPDRSLTMTDQSTGTRCGNNPNYQMSDGDRKAVEDFKARLALQAAAKPYIERAVWVDFDPLMEVIAATIWEHCARDVEDQPRAVCDDPRTIAAFAAAVARAHAAAAPSTDQAALDRIRVVLETEAVVGRSALEYRGLIASALMADAAAASAVPGRPDSELMPDRLEAVLTERFTELGNPYSEMRRHEQGPDGWPASHPVGPHHVAEVLRELLAAGAQQPDAAS
jgi:hypothetical protein